MGSMIKACFFDIDGTLIDHEGGSVMPESTKRSLHALREKGVKLFVATGRIPSMLGFLEPLFQFDGFVSLNGQLVALRDGTVLHRMAHDPGDIRQLIRIVEEKDFPCLIIEEKESFCATGSPASEAITRHYRNERLAMPPLYDLARLDDHPVLQFLVYGVENLPYIAGLPHIEPTSAGGHIQDIIPKGGGKEVGIAAVAAHYGIQREEVMVFGDGDNDQRMLRWAGIGVAMGNGSPKAKAAASYISTHTGQDGIYNALRHFGVL